MEFGSYCYEFNLTHTQDFRHAEDDCARKGGRQVTIHDAQEQEFIVNALRGLHFQGTGIWIGLSDSHVEGRWDWASGEYMYDVYKLKQYMTIFLLSV
jgi:hypothetical protein